MNQEAILWMFGIVQTAMLLAFGGGLAWLLIIVQRLTKVETILELIGVNAAKALHCPTTPEMDVLLEKYYDRNFELSLEEWKAMLDYYQNILDDQSQPRSYRLAAGQLVAVCHHKLMHPPPKVRKFV